jgi:hypothetical protein
MRKCQRTGCARKVSDRHRLCPRCRRQGEIKAAEARGRWVALGPEITDSLRPILDDLLVLTHPDLHRQGRHHALAEELTRQLLQMREELI